jgi:transcriptional regulator with XRE-family HTH domain
MTMDEQLGDRIRLWRRRRGGMSQQVLAGLAGLSQSYLSEIESGRKPLDRKATQAAIAGALNISVAQLLGEPGAQDDPVRARALAHVPAIRASLVEISTGERRTPTRSVDQLTDDVRHLTDARNAADYATVAQMLPALLLDLHGHGNDTAPLLVEALFGTRYALKTMGYQDLGLTAAQVGVRVAEDHGDPAWRGQAIYSLAQAFPVESATLGAATITQAADDLQGSPDRGGREVYGCLHILASNLHASAGNGDQAAAHLDEAAEVAAALGEPERHSGLSAGFNGNWFSPTQVEVWRVAAAAELGDAGAAVAVADRVDLTALPVPNRHVFYWIDLARALASGDQDQEALHALGRAERSAPQHFRFSPISRNLVTTLVGRAKRRAVAGEMLTLAHKLGLDPL